MEVLNLLDESKGWELIELGMHISPRQEALISPVNETELLIAGGFYKKEDGKGALHSDAYLFNTEQKAVTRQVTDSMALAFQCLSPAVNESTGVVVALVSGRGSILQLIRYDVRANQLNVLKKFGKWK